MSENEDYNLSVIFFCEALLICLFVLLGYCLTMSLFHFVDAVGIHIERIIIP